jgi:hypothetical protein
VSNFTNYTENQLIDHLYRAATFTKPTAMWHALYTAAPGEAGGGTEVTGGSYARVNLAPSDTNWTATQGGTSGASSGTTGQTSNAVAITFPTPSAAWGTISHMAQLSASSGGNPYTYGALGSPKTVNNGDPAPSFAIGALTVTID